MILNKAWGGVKPLNVICGRRWIAVCAVVVATAAGLFAQSQVAQRPGRITEEIDSRRTVTLTGNVRADLTPDRDLGAVEDEKPLRLYLVLQRTAEQQADLDNLIARQQQPTAAEYHKWLTPQEFGARFGASPQDIEKITTWLESQGLHVNGVMNNNMFIDFSATAGQVREVFQAQMHYYNIRGGKYAANAQEPAIPAALAAVVSGIKGLSKIPPHAQHTTVHHGAYDPATHRSHRVESEGSAAASPAYYNSYDSEYDVTPQDYYAIYNVNPVFNGSANLGQGATIAVIEESDFEYGTVNPSTGQATGGDVNTFRSLFGVPGTLNMYVYHGYGQATCSDPGVDPSDLGEDAEAALDSEWANAMAPSAKLIVMTCDNVTDNGIITSMMAVIDQNLADAMSLSYGESEDTFGPSDYTFQDNMYSQAAVQGQSIFIAGGDGGSDVNDWVNDLAAGTSGVNVSGYSSSPNVTSAGGTDFSDVYDQLVGNSQVNYWSAANGYATGYVPETVWTDSCASSMFEWYYDEYTGDGLCGNASDPLFGAPNFAGSSGGFSSHYSVPAYQSGITGYSGSTRAQPDISLFASDGFWSHALIFCDSYGSSDYPAPGDNDAGDAPCVSGDTSTYGLAGGTSFVAPSLAGVTGLLVTATGSRQGTLNPGLYALAKAQFTASATKSACYSNGQTANTGVTTGLPASACIFNDVTTGNNSQPCVKGSPNCYTESGGSYGILSLSTGSAKPAYAAGAGYDEATGIGSLNVYNLISKWYTAFSSTTALTANPTTIAANGSTTLTATVTRGVPTGSTYTPQVSGSVNFAAGSTALGSCVLSGGSCMLAVSGSSLATGSNSISATFAGSANYPASTSSIVTVTVAAGLKTQTITFNPLPNVTYGVSPITLTATGGGSGNPVTYGVSGPASIAGSVLTITGAGAVTVTANQAGNASYSAATPVPQSFTVNPAALTVVANNLSLVKGSAIPTLTGTLTGVVSGDGITATYTTTATSGSAAGTYAITPVLSDPKDKLPNYIVSSTNGALVIYNATSAPLALWMSPASATAGGAGFTLTVSGANFNSKSVVLWNGSERATQFVSSTELTATILAGDILKQGTDLVTVANPTPNAGTSSSVPFVVMSSTPVATITGASLADGSSGSHVLLLTGTDFVPTSTVMLNGVSLTTTYVSASQLSAVVTASQYGSLPAAVTVVNPSGTSNAFEVE